MWNNVTVLEEHLSGTPQYIPSSLYTLGKFWYTLECTIHSVDKHWRRLSHQHGHTIRPVLAGQSLVEAFVQASRSFSQPVYSYNLYISSC